MLLLHRLDSAGAAALIRKTNWGIFSRYVRAARSSSVDRRVFGRALLFPPKRALKIDTKHIGAAALGLSLSLPCRFGKRELNP